jgi:hypothetical protein
MIAIDLLTSFFREKPVAGLGACTLHQKIPSRMPQERVSGSPGYPGYPYDCHPMCAHTAAPRSSSRAESSPSPDA